MNPRHPIHWPRHDRFLWIPFYIFNRELLKCVLDPHILFRVTCILYVLWSMEAVSPLSKDCSVHLLCSFMTYHLSRALLMLLSYPPPVSSFSSFLMDYAHADQRLQTAKIFWLKEIHSLISFSITTLFGLIAVKRPEIYSSRCLHFLNFCYDSTDSNLALNLRFH